MSKLGPARAVSESPSARARKFAGFKDGLDGAESEYMDEPSDSDPDSESEPA